MRTRSSRIDLVNEGKTVCAVSSGDGGVYGMAVYMLAEGMTDKARAGTQSDEKE